MPKKPQQVPKQWYKGLKLMDLSGIREKKKGACKSCKKTSYYIKDYKSKPRE